jgi:hypothetical protein
MNDIDMRIFNAVNDYYREHQEPPTLCVVHPLLYRNKTIYDVKIPLLPEINLATMLEEPTLPPPPIEVVTIRIEQMVTDDRYGIIEKLEPIVCLSKMQMMQAIVKRLQAIVKRLQ